MRFEVIDTKTGLYADAAAMAINEDWAKSLDAHNIFGFAITEDGKLILLDKCGNFAYCPKEGRFHVIGYDY